MNICKLCIPSQKIIIGEDDKIWFDSNLRTAIRLRDRFRRFYLKNKSEHNYSKFKKPAKQGKQYEKNTLLKEKFYTDVNEILKDIKSSNSRLYWKTIKNVTKK